MGETDPPPWSNDDQPAIVDKEGEHLGRDEASEDTEERQPSMAFTREGDEEFGDFDDFEDFTAALPSSTLAQEWPSSQHQPVQSPSLRPSNISRVDQQLLPSVILEEAVTTPRDEAEEERLSKALSLATLDDVQASELREQTIKVLKLAFPIPLTSLSSNKAPSTNPDSTVKGFLYEEGSVNDESTLPNTQPPPSPSSWISPSQPAKPLIVPNPTLFASEPWYSLYRRLASESMYNDLNSVSNNSRFRWRKSNIRRAFLNGLGVPLTLDDSQCGGGGGASIGKLGMTTQAPYQQSGGSVRGSLDSESGGSILTNGVRDTSLDGNRHAVYDGDLGVAKRLAEISEDRIRRMTVQELGDLKTRVVDSTQRMQDQVNFWLDGREQLVMDAEMHNKMIASLVQYAQQQQLHSAAAAKQQGKKPSKTKDKR
ncbi:hypothetical protein SeMB42_g02839 [Synchytrium endobioticum]|uniref:Uncharacterized protein n=1 Tax=Synchytrium endobioticum TaxID=286115 RepID=A0A507CS20_9FUNG|nr:hypothetical protein SeLEV6574_g05840 [Synchytrium endobioticum]TPX48823.1 hypothetical protein SeMB42_g02839 [Synchytrium endobioticum]